MDILQLIQKPMMAAWLWHLGLIRLSMYLQAKLQLGSRSCFTELEAFF